MLGSDGDDGELELPEVCKYATMWDHHKRTGTSGMWTTSVSSYRYVTM